MRLRNDSNERYSTANSSPNAWRARRTASRILMRITLYGPVSSLTTVKSLGKFLSCPRAQA
jgi:hypothetical protein